MNSPRVSQVWALSEAPVGASAGWPSTFSALPDAVRASDLPRRDLPPPVRSAPIPFRVTLEERLAGQSQENLRRTAMATLEELSYGINLTGQDPAELTKALTQLAAEILRDPARLVRAGAERAFSEAALALE